MSVKDKCAISLQIIIERVNWKPNTAKAPSIKGIVNVWNFYNFHGKKFIVEDIDGWTFDIMKVKLHKKKHLSIYHPVNWICQLS